MGIRLSITKCRRTAVFEAAGAFVIVAASAALGIMSCSGRTTVDITVDLLTYFESDERVVEFWLPPFATYDFYFLPGVQLDATGSGPDSSRRGGMIIDLPAAPEAPPLSGFTVTFEGAITVRNSHQTGILQLVHLSVIAAPVSATDIYDQGVVLVSVPVDPIGPGESLDAKFLAHLDEGSPLSEIIDTSSMRLGLRLTYPETTGKTMKAGFELTQLQLSASGRPFLLLS